ncbi:MAG: cell division protein FtsZ [Bacteroidetes bacterium GWF2_42_66]|nr:MAG: cell division protein FtsZ [Bacteroidetes bacterium GWA2_42_15]OFY00176.1 MAG: cell division protein FtsZ [Bacteroidetes bacterium GWE2_42_39]OFY40358.1 MAG: cell division protein FtsZ [Bacteroidetes bacterium GWF2_42_66]HBL73697.1 cell division protein FtsZ [Prolixibacteraceae bacterium]HCR90707.1 cell division protein FtsZ [Prolixibacteraceae bacterium]
MNFSLDRKSSSIIKVIGVGGGGGNAVNHMFAQGIKDVDFVICNTDSQALINSAIPIKIQLGSSLTEGRGAGNKPEIGRDAAIENIDDVKKVLADNTKMVFITAGMGGGTGTGGAPVIAEAARELDILTVGIVTLPFRNEGRRRIKQAIDGIAAMEKHVDSLLVINNERIREMYGDSTISEAFSKADDVLTIAAKGIAEIITVAGYINVDFADVQTVMQNSGVAVMGSAKATGENRALHAIEEALNSPLLNNNNINGAKNILLNITSGRREVTMDEIGDITDYIQDKAGHEADLIWGNGVDESLEDEISVTVIATGFSTSSIPEMVAAKQPEKTYHTLIDKPVQKVPVSQPIVKEKTETTKHFSKQVSQPTFEFELSPGESDEFDNLYGKRKTQSEPEHNVSVKVDYAESSDEIVEELENIPAYRRKKFKVKGLQKRFEQKLSRFSLSPDEDDKIVLRDNNPYLHDNVD